MLILEILNKIDAERALRKVTALPDLARAITQAAPGQLTAETEAQIPEAQLRTDPVLAAAFIRGWEARTVDIQKTLRASAPANPAQRRETQRPAPRPVGSQKRQPTPSPVSPTVVATASTSTAAPERRTKWLTASQKRALRLQPEANPHLTTTEWTGMLERRPRILPVSYPGWVPTGVARSVAKPAPSSSKTVKPVSTPRVETAVPVGGAGPKQRSEAAVARRKRSFAKLAEKRKERRKTAQSQ